MTMFLFLLFFPFLLHQLVPPRHFPLFPLSPLPDPSLPLLIQLRQRQFLPQLFLGFQVLLVFFLVAVVEEILLDLGVDEVEELGGVCRVGRGGDGDGFGLKNQIVIGVLLLGEGVVTRAVRAGMSVGVVGLSLAGGVLVGLVGGFVDLESGGAIEG